MFSLPNQVTHFCGYLQERDTRDVPGAKLTSLVSVRHPWLVGDLLDAENCADVTWCRWFGGKKRDNGRVRQRRGKIHLRMHIITVTTVSKGSSGSPALLKKCTEYPNYPSWDGRLDPLSTGCHSVLVKHCPWGISTAELISQPRKFPALREA